MSEKEIIEIFHFNNQALIKNVNELKLLVAKFHSNHQLMRKTFNTLRKNARENKSIQELCHRVRSNEITLSQSLSISSLKPSIVKLIFALNHYRVKLMQRIFNRFKTINLFR